MDRFKSLKPKGIDTMATTKMTNKTAFELAISALENSGIPQREEAIAKIAKAIEQLDKKNSKTSGKLTAKQTANLGLGEMIVQYLAEHPTQMFTIAELMKNIEGLPEDISNQKMTSIFRLESVKPYYTRELVKGRAYFQYKATSDEVAEDEE